MINNEELYKIVNKPPKQLRNKVTGELVNQYTFSTAEQLEVVRKYIFDVKNVDVGEIKQPNGTICNSFVHKAIQKGIHPMTVLQKGDDIHCLMFCFEQACVYYKNKENENNN